MNEFKGTPGPWFHHGASGSQHTMGGYVNSSPERNGSNLVCSIYGTNGQPHEENAKLIAAAPRLYAALARLTQAAQDANVGYLDAAVAKGWEALESATSNSN